MPEIQDYELFHIVTDAVLALTGIATVSLSIQSLCSVSRLKDPARRCFSWFKGAFGIFAIYVFLRLLTVVFLTVLCRFYGYDTYSGSDRRGPYVDGVSVPVVFVMLSVTAFLDTLSHTLVCVALFHLFWGLRMSAKMASPESGHRVMRGIYIVAGILACIEVAGLVVGGLSPWNIKGALMDSIGFDFTVNNLGITHTIIQILCGCVLALADLVLLGLSIYARKTTKSISHLRRITKLYIVCVVMLLVKCAFTLWQAPSAGSYTAADLNGLYFTLGEVVEVLFSVWPSFIIFTIFFSEGVRKRSGLRSSHLPPGTDDVEISIASAPRSSDAQSQYRSPQPDEGQNQHVVATSPIEPTRATPSSSPAAPAAAAPNVQSQDAFPWAIHADEAPPEYSLPAHPLPTGSQFSTVAQSQTPGAPGQEQVLNNEPSSPGVDGRPELRNGTSEHTGALVSNGGLYQSSQPPDHDEAMGLYHQADGRVPETELLPLPPKKD